MMSLSKTTDNPKGVCALLGSHRSGPPLSGVLHWHSRRFLRFLVGLYGSCSIVKKRWLSALDTAIRLKRCVLLFVHIRHRWRAMADGTSGAGCDKKLWPPCSLLIPCSLLVPSKAAYGNHFDSILEWKSSGESCQIWAVDLVLRAHSVMLFIRMKSEMEDSEKPLTFGLNLPITPFVR